MKKVKNDVQNCLKTINGSLIFIGSDNEYLKCIEQNKKIFYCDVLNSTNIGGIGKKKSNKKTNTLNIKDLKKFYGKKKVNYIICDINEIIKYIPKFIPISIYICNCKLCFYGKKDLYDLDLLCSKYKRYGCEIKLSEYIDEYYVEIDLSNVKNKFFRDKYYYVIDSIRSLNDKISDSIIS